MKRLDGKITIVAGGATGIGAGTALRLAAEGATVVIGDVNLEPARQVAARITAEGGKAIALHCDIGEDASVASMVRATVDTYGGLDGIHVNAADLSIIAQDLDVLAISMEIFDRTIAIDLRGHVLCTRHALPALLARGGGAIVYTTSGAVTAAESTRVGYACAKAGVNALMRHVAARWGRERMRSNAVSPGLVMSETALANVSAERQAAFLATSSSFRLGAPADIAAAVAFLMSQDGEWVNGQVITVDGGPPNRP